MRVVSFSLWGNNPKYVVGALRNAELAPVFYPGWWCRFHCGTSVPEDAVARLAAFAHVDVVRQPVPGDWMGMFWRFLPAAEDGVDVTIVRDADSRLNARERAAVDAWLVSGRDVHVMRDHPDHVAPILGGMWGVRGGALPDLGEQVRAWPKENRIQVDQDFLAACVAMRVAGRCLEHDEYFARRPFPTRRVGRQFVGQPFDEHDRPLIEGPTDLDRRLRQAAQALLHTAGLRPAPPTVRL